ncbi:MAG: inositol monophosphatase family protein [Nanobdellota archaeon]
MNYKEFCYDIAKQAGKLIKDNFQLITAEYKEDTSPVTEVDIAVNKLLLKKVEETYPLHNVIGEEESSDNQDSDYKWVCDPVDGTIPYSASLPISCFSLALVYKGKPIVGVVYDPFIDRLFYAEDEKGAFLNDKPLKVNQKTDKSKILISLDIFLRSKYDLIEVHSKLTEENVKVLELSSIILPSVMVASGNITGTIFPNNTVHDMAAVKVIVEEAGGKVTDFSGNNQRYDQPINGAIVSNGLMHNYLLDLVKNYSKERN